ncbi:IclR family transcriptional regulator [Nocardia bovistercoris]|uniref:IclR family transcriptional regulator n=1 Tax=Nocardia bovistercoris TaxID=2785916 RepID=A0A931N6M5_9NOCA|nr:IclR family transcriptional regulator [Nocardia bovistercoris]MBH0779843.1 IclR family transcriptional regulator [Nocardia bovistercoris]
MPTSTAEPLRDDRAAVDKAISLLAAFDYQSHTGIGVSELARRAQLSKSTAFRVLALLERNDVVERVGTGYRLGARLHRLGQAAYTPENERTRDLLLPYLTDLYESTHHTVHLAALHGTEVVYLAKLYGHRSVAAPSRIGGRLPAHATAVGKAMLAYHPVAATRAGTEPLAALTEWTITETAHLERDLGEIRRRGIALDHQESRAGLTCMAAPILDRRGRPLAALSIAAPAGHLDTAALEPRLRRTCTAAARALLRLEPAAVGGR